MAKVPKKYFERLVDNSLDIVVATDTHGRVIFYNDGAAKSLGHAREEIIGKHVLTLYPSIEEARKVMWAMRSDPQGRIVNFETTFILQSGEQIPVTVSGAIIYSDKHEEIGTIGFAKDIREIRRKDQLATLGEIAVGLGHEINNPLTIILNNLELVQSSLKDEPARRTEVQQLDAIRQGVERIRRRIERIETMARSGVYASTEYLRGAQMIDLASGGEAKKEVSEKEPVPEMAGLSVLVVDDDAGVTKSIEEILTREGCQVCTAGSGEEALALVKGRHFDLVLSAVVMPKMDGYDLFTGVRTVSPRTAVILMTAYYYDKDHIIKRSMIEGLEGSVFKKPINPDYLKKVIVKACRRPI